MSKVELDLMKPAIFPNFWAVRRPAGWPVGPADLQLRPVHKLATRTGSSSGGGCATVDRTRGFPRAKMNARQLSLVLVVLNLGLLGVVVYLATARNGVDSGVVAPSERRAVTNTVTQIAVRKVNATNILAALANRPLNWRMLESTNYFLYAQNLRNFGCPEETVRDIIITDVVKSYAERRRELRGAAPPPEYWRTSNSGNGAPGEPAELRRELADLDREQAQLVRDLLGVDLDSELARYVGDADQGGPVVSFLPEGKRESVRLLQDKYSAMEDSIYEQSGGLLLDSDREALRQIQKQREAELAQILAPDELLAYQLYNSDTANNLRLQLNGFNPTQEEFTRIFQLQKSYDDQFGQAFDLTDEGAMGIRARAEQDAGRALEDELRKVLGPQRYSEYQRAQDDDYRALLQIAERYQLSPEVANNVYTMKLAAERQKLQVETNPNLTDVQRAEMLASLAQATERNVASALGSNLYKNYQTGPGQWLNNLYFFDEANLPPEQPEPARNTFNLPPLSPGMLNSLPPGYRELLLNQPGLFPPAPPAPPARKP